MVCHAAQIQLEGSESALNTETIAVKADNRGRVKAQICTDKDNALPVIFRKDKTEFPVQPLSPKKVNGVIADSLFLSVQPDFFRPERRPFRFKQVRQPDFFAFARLPSSLTGARFGRFPVSDGGEFHSCDEVNFTRVRRILGRKLPQRRDGGKIAVKEVKTVFG